MPKTIRNVWEQALTYEKLYKAYVVSRKGKTKRKDVILFSLKYESNIKDILNDLINGTYKFNRYNVFYVYEPKKRKVLAATFRDRVVHTWYVREFIVPYMQTQFIYTSYACIENKGMHMSAKDVQKAMRVVQKKYENPYILKMDITKYFENINREKLYEIISRKIKDMKVLDLTKQILDTSNPYDSKDRKCLGLPIGNYTSQMFANIYMNEIDRYSKHILKCKWYYRYLDDTVIIIESKEKAKELLELITVFLRENLGLTLNKKTNIFKLLQGVNYCGYKINVSRIRIRDRGKKKLKLKLRYINKSLTNGTISLKEAKRSLNGHIGYIQLADVNGIVRKYFRNI
ncbi:MAG: reverse transcriptase domain-containing protein [Clostridia bacterium]|nr:reverse transcriptase domain-containing protein [Clostridia bacterium]MDD4375486.1 reverse transcriptase domain-containing protein [Clostridia bacterium]